MKRNALTNFLGGHNGKVKADLRWLRLADGDRLLLCSDGLNEMVDDVTIGRILATAREPASGRRPARRGPQPRRQGQRHRHRRSLPGHRSQDRWAGFDERRARRHVRQHHRLVHPADGRHERRKPRRSRFRVLCGAPQGTRPANPSFDFAGPELGTTNAQILAQVTQGDTRTERGPESPTGHAAPEEAGWGRVRLRAGGVRFSRLRSSGKVSGQEQRIASRRSAAHSVRLPS